MIINWLLAIGIMSAAIGAILCFMGIPHHARYGYSKLIDIGELMVLIPLGGLMLGVASWMAYTLVTIGIVIEK